MVGCGGASGNILAGKTHRFVARYMRTKSGLAIDARNYDADNFLVVGKTAGFARMLVRYDAHGRFLSQECFDEHNKPMVCGRFSKVAVEYDADGKTRSVLMQGTGGDGEPGSFRVVVKGNDVECLRLDGEGKVREESVRKADDLLKELMYFGRIRYSVDSNRRPAQVVVQCE